MTEFFSEFKAEIQLFCSYLSIHLLAVHIWCVSRVLMNLTSTVFASVFAAYVGGQVFGISYSFPFPDVILHILTFSLHNKQLLSEIMQIEAHEPCFLSHMPICWNWIHEKGSRWEQLGLLQTECLACSSVVILPIMLQQCGAKPLLSRWDLEQLLPQLLPQ